MSKTNRTRTVNMLKRVFFLIILFVGVGGVSINASEPNQPTAYKVYLQAKPVDVNPTPVNGGSPRGPIQVPSVTLDDHTLYTGSVWFDSTLRLLDSNEDVVYTTFVPAYTPTVTLPSDLDGTLQIQFLWNNWCFYGWITLFCSML